MSGIVFTGATALIRERAERMRDYGLVVAVDATEQHDRPGAAIRLWGDGPTDTVVMYEIEAGQHPVRAEVPR